MSHLWPACLFRMGVEALNNSVNDSRRSLNEGPSHNDAKEDDEEFPANSLKHHQPRYRRAQDFYIRIESHQAEISQEPPWRFGEEKNGVQLKVDRTHASWALEMIGEKALYEELSDGSIILYETVRDWRIFRTFVLSFLDAAELLEPPECRESLIEWLESIQ